MSTAQSYKTSPGFCPNLGVLPCQEPSMTRLDLATSAAQSALSLVLLAAQLNEVNKGGHFAAWEQPELFAAELRAAFRSLR